MRRRKDSPEVPPNIEDFRRFRNINPAEAGKELVAHMRALKPKPGAAVRGKEADEYFNRCTELRALHKFIVDRLHEIKQDESGNLKELRYAARGLKRLLVGSSIGVAAGLLLGRIQALLLGAAGLVAGGMHHQEKEERRAQDFADFEVAVKEFSQALIRLGLIPHPDQPAVGGRDEE